MLYALIFALLAVGLFAGMLAAVETGRRIGLRRRADDPAEADAGTSGIEGAVLALLGLLIAFTFSGAMSRFDARRELVVQEANDIGTAWLRIDLLPAEAQPAMRQRFRDYVDARLDFYRLLPDIDAARDAHVRSGRLQGEIWVAAVAACKGSPRAFTGTLVLPALNDMFDVTTTRTMSMWMHPPVVVYVMLFALALASALLAGYAMSRSRARNWLHTVCYALALAAAVYVTFDVEYPRVGLIRIDPIDRALVTVRDTMK